MAENSDQTPEQDQPLFTFESFQYIRIPMRRIGAVIGKGGNNREEIEKATLTKIIIDSDTGEVEIRPEKDLKDPVMLIKATEIVKAIGRGFYYKTALKLIGEDYFLDIIQLKSTIGKNPKALKRIKSRIIGSEGRTKKIIEELTSTALVISGSTVALIGTFERNLVANNAVMKIVSGAQIETVVKFMEEKKKELDSEDEEIEEKGIVEKDVEEEDVFADFKEE